MVMKRIMLLLLSVCVFAGSQAQTQEASEKPTVVLSSEDYRNRIAILPFTCLQDGTPVSEQMGEKIQQEVFTYLTEKNKKYVYLNPRNTNVLLMRGGVTKANIRNYTMEELCKILGVEFLIEGNTSWFNAGQIVKRQNSGGSETKDAPDGKEKKYNASTTEIVRQEYNIDMNISIYNNTGATVYSKQHRSVYPPDFDAYKPLMGYLLKRSPFYKK